MATISLAVKNLNLPVWLPTPKDVVLKCKENGHGPSVLTILSPDGSEAAFVKYGPLIDMGEARTQNFIANIVNSDKNIIVLVPRIYYAFRYDGIGYMIMQHVDGSDSNQNDYDAIVLAVNRLRSILSPTESPGPVGGGPVTHRFFADHQSSVQYDSVNDLQAHVNRVSGAFTFVSTIHLNQTRFSPWEISLQLSTSLRRTVETSASALTIFIRAIFGRPRTVNFLR
jgi:hypothetical protein